MKHKKFTTTSGIEVKEVYTGPSGMNELPGEFP
jgi:methylmalonyl-CoA mutase N-terminal domain/subunit